VPLREPAAAREREPAAATVAGTPPGDDGSGEVDAAPPASPWPPLAGASPGDAGDFRGRRDLL
jgi:hypothetical protein